MINKRSKFRFTTKAKPKSSNGKADVNIRKKPAKAPAAAQKKELDKSVPKPDFKLPSRKKAPVKKSSSNIQVQPAKLGAQSKRKEPAKQAVSKSKPDLSRLVNKPGKEKSPKKAIQKSEQGKRPLKKIVESETKKKKRGKGNVISGGKPKTTEQPKKAARNKPGPKPKGKPVKGKLSKKQTPKRTKKVGEPLLKAKSRKPEKKSSSGISIPPGAFLPGSNPKNLSSDYFFFSLYAYKNELIAMILPDGVEPKLPKGAVTAINPEYFWLSWDQLEKGGVYQQAAEMMGEGTKFRIIGPLGDETLNSFDEFGLKLSLNFIEVNNVLKNRNEKE